MMMQEGLSEGETVEFSEPSSETEHGEVTLAAHLDLRAAKPLHAKLLELRGDTIIVDAANVDRIGAQCAAILLSAARSWEADGQEFSLVNPSEAFVQGLERLGITLAEVGGVEPSE